MAVRYLVTGHDPDSGRFHFSETIAAPGTSEPVIMPTVQGRLRADDPITVACIPVGSTGKIQFTLDTPAEVVAATATWVDWSLGETTIPVAKATNGPITALRCVASVGGSVKWRIEK